MHLKLDQFKFVNVTISEKKNLKIYKYLFSGELPEEVVVSPEDAVTMMKLQSAGYWRTINTCPVTQFGQQWH